MMWHDQVLTDLMSASAALCLVVSFMSLGPLQAQDGTIVGTVVAEESLEPVRGATVTVTGTNIGALTDDEGRYRLTSVPAGAQTVRARVLGRRTETRSTTVVAGESVTVDFELVVSAVGLDEVVATVEAGAARRRETGFSPGRISAEEAVETGAFEDFTQMLTGRSSNLRIERGSGFAGTGSRVRVRGQSSITQSNVPLIVLDGIRLNNSTSLAPEPLGDQKLFGGSTISRFDDIAAEEIQSIEVLKGPTAVALYGSEAASGVLVIETKKGSPEFSEWNISIEQGLQWDRTDYPNTFARVTDFGVTSLDDPRIAQFDAVENPVTGDIFVRDNPFMDSDTRPFDTGHGQKYHISFRGGTGDVNYYNSIRWQRQQGTFETNLSKRLNLRNNLQFRPLDFLSVRTSAGYVNSDLRLPDSKSSGNGLGVGGLLGFPLFSFGTDPDLGPGEGVCLFNELTGQNSNVCELQQGNFTANFDKIATIDNSVNVDRVTGAVTGDFDPVPWMTGSVTLGFDQTNRQIKRLVPFDPDLPFSDDSRGEVFDNQTDNTVFTVDVGSTFSFPLSDALESSTSVGAQLFRTTRDETTCTGERFPAPGVTSCNSAEIQNAASRDIVQIEGGIFGQQRFAYNDYAFVSGAVRVDNNSSLGADEDVIVSPSVNASVVVTDMPFWNVGWVSSLRLRGAWGKASQSPDPFTADRTFRSEPVAIDGQQGTGVTPAFPGNSELGPERTEEFEAGADAGLLNQRLNLSFTYFTSETTDAIISRTVAPSEGFPGPRFENIGKLDNEGIEVELDARVLDVPGFSWDVQVTHATTDPIITDLGLDEPIFFPTGFVGSSRAVNSQVFAEGFAPGAFVSPVITSATRDEDGKITSVTFADGNLGDGSNRRVVGQPWPKSQQSMRTSFRLGDGIRVSTLVERVAGHELLNGTRNFRTPFVDAFQFSSFNREWALRQLESSPEQQAMLEQGLVAGRVENGNFIKWREATLSYELPEFVVSSLPLAEGATLTVGGRELATFTDFSGIDPEVNITGGDDNFVRNDFASIGVPTQWFSRIDLRF